MTPRDFAISVVRTLQEAEHQAVFAGGCVRDQLLGLEPEDYDVATDATPDQVQKLFPRTIAIGASFGVIEVLGPKVQSSWLTVQVATFRSDGNYSDGRRPDRVVFSSAEADAQRRDFTINGLFFNPITDQLLDYVGGQSDLKNKILRAIGDPALRFAEDKLRLLRAVRIAARFGLTIDPATQTAARDMADQIAIVSAERIAEELRKLLAHSSRARGLALMRDLGLVKPIFPGLESDLDLAIRTVDNLSTETIGDFVPALASTLRTRPIREVRSIARRLKLSNEESDRLVFCLERQSDLHEPLLPSRIYPLLIHDWWPSLLAVALAMAKADNNSIALLEQCIRLKESKSHVELNPPPIITGVELQAAGWPTGPRFKHALKAVRDAQLNGEIRTKHDAMALASKFFM